MNGPSTQAWSILPDRPVGLKGDLLWEGGIIREQIQGMAERIVAPLFDDSPEYQGGLSDSMTLAIFGKWGMGKSSALRMLQEATEEVASRNNVPERLKFCSYLAPMHESLPYPARYTLALRMLIALGGSPQQAVKKFLNDVLGGTYPDDILPPGEPDNSKSRTDRTLQGVTSALTQLVDFDEILADTLSESPTNVLVVLVDDLDRCEIQFVWDVLSAIQQLSSVQNLFFVLAVDQAKLREAVKARMESAGGASDPDFALEKYVQHAITVPDMDEQRLADFAKRLMTSYGDDPAATAIVQNVLFLRFGLRECTPRSVKRCINTVRFDLQHGLDHVPPEDQPLVVKERILEYTWSDFYREYLEPAKDDPNSLARSAFTPLELACAENVSGLEDDEESLRFHLKRISGRFGTNWDGLPMKLLRYLGLPPYWFIRPPGKDRGFMARMLKGLPTTQEGKARLSDKTGVKDKFESIFFQSEAEDAAGNGPKAVQLVEDLYGLVMENREAFSDAECPLVGNAALTAEKWQAHELATKLYQLAVELDPNHPNNLQNFVDFIVNRRLEDLYDDAQSYLDRLKTGRLASHRPDRTLALEARLAALQGEGAFAGEQVQRMVETFLQNPKGSREFRSLAATLDQIGAYDQLERVSRGFYEVNQVSSNNRYTALRVMADALASGDDNCRGKAMEIYRFLLASQTYAGTDFDSEIADMAHNYASLLYGYDYDDEAGRFWFDAYQRKRTDSTIRRSYSMYLLRAGRPDLATLANESKPLGISEPILQPKLKEIPTHFADASVERWWEV